MYDYRIKKGSVQVVDGDTIRCVLDLGFSILHKATIRLAGINCPETRTRNLVEKVKTLNCIVRKRRASLDV